MDIRNISDGVSVAPQIAVGDVATLAAQGYRSVICNRPDHEDPGQPTAAEIAERAREEGLSFAMVPMSNQQGMTPELVQQMADALETLPKPILAYCRSGTRSTHLFLASERLRQGN